MWDIDFPNVRIFFIFQIGNLKKLLIIENYWIIILLVNYLGNLLIFQIKNFWNFLYWKFLGKIQNYEYQNNERWIIFYLRIYFFVFKIKLENLRNLLFFFWKIIKFAKFKNLGNVYNLEKLLNTLSVGWGSKFRTTKYRTTDISKFQNSEYYNNER